MRFVSYTEDGTAGIAAAAGGRHIPKASALDHVVGYSVFNEASVRDFQLKPAQWTVGKNFDGTGALGPALVTADELPPGDSGLAIRTRLNGQTVQDSSAGDRAAVWLSGLIPSE